jgi:hypothetical protein
MSELESCGGCLHGSVNLNGTLDYASPGSEYVPYISNVEMELMSSCTASGASLGAATCTNGQCEYTACQRGYELLEGYCMPILRR